MTLPPRNPKGFLLDGPGDNLNARPLATAARARSPEDAQAERTPAPVAQES